MNAGREICGSFREGSTGAHQSLRLEKPVYPRGLIGKVSTVAPAFDE